ncbi:aminodeoxychorismate lyase, partial [Methylobacterium sp. WL9]
PGQPGRASAYAPGSNAAFAADGGAPDANGRRSKAFDASEGTKLDPLKNRSYDLSSPKTVPQMKNP